MSKPTIAVSACLLGERVRFDGQHKELGWIRDRLAKVANVVAVCPEVEVGLGVPREPIQLELEGEEIVLRKVNSRTDITQEMLAYAEQKIQALKEQRLNGYIFKSKSPSCGLQVKIFDQTGKGLFAEQFTKQLQLVPVIEETALSQEAARASFLTKVFSLFRLQEFWQSAWTAETLGVFHRTHKLLLMAYSPERYQGLNHFLAKGAEREDLQSFYDEEFRKAFAGEASVERHVKALQHAASYFHGAISGAGRYTIQQAIQEYQSQKASLQKPLQMIEGGLQRCKISYLMQHYFEPFPRELWV